MYKRQFAVSNPRVSVVVGKAPQEETAPPQSAPSASPSGDALDALLAFGEQFDNITIR